MGNCASHIQADTGISGRDGSNLAGRPHHMHSSITTGVTAVKAPAQASLSVRLNADALQDDVLGEVLSQLPLLHLVQLSTASKRLYQLIQRSDKVLKAVDLSQVPPEKLQAALSFLSIHPASDAVHTATLPSNCPNSLAALSVLTGLISLKLFRAGKQLLAEEPPVLSLPLEGLTQLTQLSMVLAPGDVPKGQKMHLPQALCSFSLSAPTFSAGINPLVLTGLTGLSSLSLKVMDAANSNPLSQLLQLQGLKHLSLGRFWSVPTVLSSFSALSSLEVSLYGKVSKVPQGSLEAPLSADACGLHHLPTRPNMHLVVSVSVLADCDGLSSDWSHLINLRHLNLENIYPLLIAAGSSSSGGGGGSSGGGQFGLSPLSELNRLTGLELGFEAQRQVAGISRRLELIGLQDLVHLKELSVTSTGPWVDLSLEAPRYLTSLLIACEGKLLLAAPGTAAAEATAAATSKRAAAAAATAASNPQGADGPAWEGGGSGSSLDAAHNHHNHQNQQQQQQQQKKAYALTTLQHEKQQQQQQQVSLLHGQLSKLLPAANHTHSSNGGSCSVSSNSCGSSPVGSPRNSFSSCGSNGGCGSLPLSPTSSYAVAASKDAGLLLSADSYGSDAAAVLVMQRRIDRLGSIVENQEVYHTVDDEAQQLSHIGKLGLLVGGGIRMKDHSAVMMMHNLLPDAPTAAGASAGGGAGATRGRRLGPRSSKCRTGNNKDAADVDFGGDDGLPLDAWLAAKGLDLTTLQLVQQQLPQHYSHTGSTATTTTNNSNSNKAGRGWSVGGKDADVARRGSVSSNSGYQLLARSHMEDSLLNTFREWGFVK